MNRCVTAQPFESCTWVRCLLFLDVTFTHGCRTRISLFFVQHILIILIVIDLVINVLSSFGKLFQISPPHAPVMRLKFCSCAKYLFKHLLKYFCLIDMINVKSHVVFLTFAKTLPCLS